MQALAAALKQCARRTCWSHTCQALNTKTTLTWPCRYANLERSLGEVDRARAILVHASGMADPRGDPGFWEDWKVCTLLFCSLSVRRLPFWAAELVKMSQTPVHASHCAGAVAGSSVQPTALPHRCWWWPMRPMRRATAFAALLWACCGLCGAVLLLLLLLLLLCVPGSLSLQIPPASLAVAM